MRGIAKGRATGPQSIGDYDHVIVAFSGGKDSLACLLHLLDLGVPKDRIELWHHLVDGRESSLMDWPVTEDYCLAIAQAFGVRIFFSWKEGGFEREMLRQDSPTAPIHFETPDGESVVGGNGPNGTRQKFPQVSGNLAVRWCSAYLKIDVAAAALRNDLRFTDAKTLVVTGERAEESAGRAKYAAFEPHKADLRHGAKQRLIDHWRPVHQWREADVWKIIQKHRVNPHPAYWLGFGRTSCMKCIFGNPNQWATVRNIDPPGFFAVSDFETRFGVSIHRKKSVLESAYEGRAYSSSSGTWRKIAMSKNYHEPVFLEHWTIPPGAYADGCGPT